LGQTVPYVNLSGAWYYIIVYDIDGEDVQILRGVHSRRNLAALFGR
jgi:hypothetical protein